MIRRFWPIVFFIIGLTAACQPANNKATDPIRHDDALAAVMATGVTRVVIHGPRFRCAPSGEPAVYTGGLHGPREGFFFYGIKRMGDRHLNVRGMVCVRNNTTPSVQVLP